MSAWESGRVEERDGFLYFPGTSDIQLEQGVAIVRWGPRHYLIPVQELDEFANEINEGFEPCYDFCAHWLRETDEQLPVVGLPVLPGPANALLQRHPLVARITAVGGGGDIILNVGRRDGVRPGLALVLRSGYAEVEIVRVNERSSLARRSELAGNGPLTVGALMSTRREYERYHSPFDAPLEIATTSVAGRPFPAIAEAPTRLSAPSAIAAARKAGFVVKPVLRLSVAAVNEAVLKSKSTESSIFRLIGQAGGNAYVIRSQGQRGKGPRPYYQEIGAYRVVWQGLPVQATEMPFYGDGVGPWKRCVPTIAVDRTAFAKESASIYRATEARLLHVPVEDLDRISDLRAESLTDEQRDGFERWGLSQYYGRIGTQPDSAWSAWADLIRAQAKKDIEALKAADPKGFAEYERLKTLKGDSWCGE